MHFKDYLQNSASKTDKDIDDFFKNWSKEIAHISPSLKPLINELWRACDGGKRIRASLIFLGFEAAGGKPGQEIRKVALGYEIFQTAILSHDDIIDESKTRRGRPTLHVALGDGQYGVSQAITLADVGIFLSYKLIAESKFPDKIIGQAFRFFSNTTLFTGLGELLDVEISHKGITREKDIVTVYSFKTAYYTIVGPLLLGASLAGASKAVLKNLEIFGHNIGLIFQMQDDIRDIFPPTNALIKDYGADIREGKYTLLYIWAKRNANQKQSKILKKYFGKMNITPTEIDLVKYVFVETGAVNHVQSLAKEYSGKAKQVIRKITPNKDLQNMFFQIADFFVL